jgi:hypothetical protein
MECSHSRCRDFVLLHLPFGRRKQNNIFALMMSKLEFERQNTSGNFDFGFLGVTLPLDLGVLGALLSLFVVEVQIENNLTCYFSGNSLPWP